MWNRKNARGVKATELVAQLQRDPEYQRRFAAAEAERQAVARALREAEQPVVSDLRAVGVDVSSVWDLVNTSDPYPAALPVLLEHMERGGYPDRVMESLGRALAVKPSVAAWERLKALYLAPRSAGEEEGAAVALAACATSAQFDDLARLALLESRGPSRIYFVRPLLAVGAEQGRRLVASLRADETLGKEASALLAGRE